MDTPTKSDDQLDRPKSTIKIKTRQWGVHRDTKSEMGASNKRLIDEDRGLGGVLEDDYFLGYSAKAENVLRGREEPIKKTIPFAQLQNTACIEKEQDRSKVHIAREPVYHKSEMTVPKSNPLKASKPSLPEKTWFILNGTVRFTGVVKEAPLETDGFILDFSKFIRCFCKLEN